MCVCVVVVPYYDPRVVLQLAATERSYVASLHTAVEVFAQPFRRHNAMAQHSMGALLVGRAGDADTTSLLHSTTASTLSSSGSALHHAPAHLLGPHDVDTIFNNLEVRAESCAVSCSVSHVQYCCALRGRIQKIHDLHEILSDSLADAVRREDYCVGDLLLNFISQPSVCADCVAVRLLITPSEPRRAALIMPFVSPSARSSTDSSPTSTAST